MHVALRRRADLNDDCEMQPAPTTRAVSVMPERHLQPASEDIFEKLPEPIHVSYLIEAADVMYSVSSQ